MNIWRIDSQLRYFLKNIWYSSNYVFNAIKYATWIPREKRCTLTITYINTLSYENSSKKKGTITSNDGKLPIVYIFKSMAAQRYHINLLFTSILIWFWGIRSYSGSKYQHRSTTQCFWVCSFGCFLYF